MANGKRFRGVRLTQEGVEVLKSGMKAQLSRETPEPKLTRLTIAETLNLSVGTSTKLLDGMRVDLASAERAFRSVGLKLEATFVRIEENTELLLQVQPSPEVEVHQSEIESVETHSSRAIKRRAAMGSLAGLSVVLALGCALTLVARKPGTKTYPRSVEGSRLHHGTVAFQSGDYNAVELLAAEIRKSAIKSESSADLSDHYLLKGELAGKSGDYKEAQRCYKACIDIWDGLGKTEKLPPLYEQLGETQLKLLEYAEAQMSFHKSLSGFKSTGDPIGCVTAMRGLGSALFEIGKLQEALEWFDEGLALIKKSEEGKEKIDIEKDVVARRALTMVTLKHSREAVSELRACLEHWKSRGHHRWMATTNLQLARAHRELNLLPESQSLAKESYRLYVSVGDFAGAKRANEFWSQPR